MIIHTFLDLCSGIGGGRLALEKLGMQSIGYSDTSKLAVKTYHLMHNAENEPYYYNLKNIKTEKIEPYDMLIAGFPCQSFSVIGRRDGFSDNRLNNFSYSTHIKRNQTQMFFIRKCKRISHS